MTRKGERLFEDAEEEEDVDEKGLSVTAGVEDELDFVVSITFTTKSPSCFSKWQRTRELEPTHFISTGVVDEEAQCCSGCS